MKVAETFRAREVYRYYQPRNLSEAVSRPDSTANSNHSSPNDDLPHATNFTTQQSFSDTALTAFAQLIALRLESQRAIVSLIDHENEYFLAESTSTLSLIGDDGPAQNAWLSISGARCPRESSLCEQTLLLIPNQETPAGQSPVYLVPDLRLDEKMSKLDCVKGAPYLRFYCGVALTNKKGIKIGCVYVVDDRPRTDFSLEQAQFLTTMAATVMDHLENIRAKEDIVRVTMMSQALHAFIEGDGTMEGDWQRLKRYNLPSGAGVGFHWETNKNDGAGSYVNGRKELGASTTALGQTQSPLQYTGNNQDARFNFNNSPWSSSSEIPQVPLLKSVFDGVDEATATLAGSRDTEFANDGFSNLLRATFGRASNLIREGMEVDGAVFFDAPFRFYQGRSTLETDPRRLDTKESSSTESEDEGREDTVRPGPHPRATAFKHHISDYGYHEPNSARLSKRSSTIGLKSDILGFSTAEASSWNSQNINPVHTFTAIDQSLLTSLVRRYPQGELFVFDENGPISPLSSLTSPKGSELTITPVEVENKRVRREARKRAEILRLLVAFPGARQIFFVPLYDSTSGCFIGSFAWSTSATRIFSIDNHLSYLVAFGHSVMSEVSRLNTLSADRAKGDFISNVSHELRSPLHGILASVEFLADTVLDGFQRNLIDTVDICGRTLLDTIEHVLDFSKIKKFGQESMQPMGVVADLDISAVIEEVIEGVFAGFEFNGLSSQGLADTTKSRSRHSSNSTVNKSSTESKDLEYRIVNDLLTVILDIDFRDNWRFPTVPGTWRRLTMNIFGNALKYTNTGYIKIKLEAKAIPLSTSTSISSLKHDGVARTMVTLTITDSGQGMSSEFMKTKLFMPFTQEDVTAPGTGLGMSIVKQIVDLSGGRIDIRSDLGKGTEIRLSLPLEDHLPDEEKLPDKIQPINLQENVIDAVRRRARGRFVTIRGFDSSFGDSNLQRISLASLKASIVKYVTEWLRLTISSDDQVADIVISDESAFLSTTGSLGYAFKSLLILCSNGARGDIYTSKLETGQKAEFVSKPFGPHRIAKALLNCLDAEDLLTKSKIEERVSLKRSRDGEVSPIAQDDILVTASITSNLRLIGDLQSSIGFSPIANIPRPCPTNKPMMLRRPTLTHRSSSGLSSRLRRDDTLSSESINDIPESDATSISENTSTSKLEENVLMIEMPSNNVAPPRQPKMLLVEDNPVNMMLLATYMKKNGWEFEKATNGLLALQAFQNRPEGFDVIFMDVSMPVMTGYESTRLIRIIESERRIAYESQQQIQSHYSPASPSFPFHLPSPIGTATSSPFFTSASLAGSTPSPSRFVDLHLDAPTLKLNRPALIIALTGFSSQKDQEMAFESGVDIFMTKPVRFREVGKILEGWMKSWDQNRKAGVEGEATKYKRKVDEGATGAKRSG